MVAALLSHSVTSPRRVAARRPRPSGREMMLGLASRSGYGSIGRLPRSDERVDRHRQSTRSDRAYRPLRWQLAAFSAVLAPYAARTPAMVGIRGLDSFRRLDCYAICRARCRIATALDPKLRCGFDGRPVPDLPPATWASSDVGDGGQGQSFTTSQRRDRGREWDGQENSENQEGVEKRNRKRRETGNSEGGEQNGSERSERQAGRSRAKQPGALGEEPSKGRFLAQIGGSRS